MRSFQIQQFGQPLGDVIGDTPKLEGSQILLKISGCGVCHSDLHLHTARGTGTQLVVKLGAQLGVQQVVPVHGMKGHLDTGKAYRHKVGKLCR